MRNTIGNVPLKWYEDYDHIGYDLDGKKISKPKDGGKTSDQLDEFLDKMEDPNYWRTVVDQQTGQKVVLSEEDIEIIKRLMMIHKKQIPILLKSFSFPFHYGTRTYISTRRQMHFRDFVFLHEDIDTFFCDGIATS